MAVNPEAKGKNLKALAGLLAGVKAGRAQARLDKRLAAHNRDVGLMPLDAVLDRTENLDTREPAPKAVDAMAESVAALGLVEPLVVDKRDRLLAGKTRLLALRQLAVKDPARWKLAPVRRMDFDAAADRGRGSKLENLEAGRTPRHAGSRRAG